MAECIEFNSRGDTCKGVLGRPTDAKRDVPLAD
jgi:hypothetical protein